VRYYELVQAIPEGSSSLCRMALVARRLGYHGIVVCNRGTIWSEKAARNVSGMEIVSGSMVAIREPRAMRGQVSRLRNKTAFVAVDGLSEAMCRTAIEDPLVDALHPFDGFRLTVPYARMARMNQVALTVDLSPLIWLRGGQRSRWLDLSRKNLQMARKFKIHLALTALPRSHLDLRGPRDLIALAMLAGMTADEAGQALEYPGKVAHLNCRHWQSPGVELL